MPTPTFINLPTEKRDRLLALALAEFAANDYPTASISRIVSQAGIAKGSLYQYFADKRALYLHLVDLASHTLLATIQADMPPTDTSFVALLRWQMSATTRAALCYPQESALLRRAYAADHADSALTAQAAALRTAHLMPLLQAAQARGELAAELELAIVVPLLSAILAEVGPLVLTALGLTPADAAQAPADVFTSPAVEQVYDQVIRLVQHGLAPVAPKE